MENKAYVESEILYNKALTDEVYLMKIKGDFQGLAGQFYMVRSWSTYPLLSRPLSICDIDQDGISFLYLVVGEGTSLFSKLKEGDKISTLGPLGNGFDLKKGKSAIIAGGIGLAPMKLLARSLEEKPDLFVGFREDKYFIEEMKDLVNNIYISSDSGLCGLKGNVLDIFENKDYETVYCCGPTPMLKAIKDKVDVESIQLSLEEHMACGIGACSGCTVMTPQGYRKVCHDGPVFDSKEVIFDA